MEVSVKLSLIKAEILNLDNAIKSARSSDPLLKLNENKKLVKQKEFLQQAQSWLKTAQEGFTNIEKSSHNMLMEANRKLLLYKQKLEEENNALPRGKELSKSRINELNKIYDTKNSKDTIKLMQYIINLR